MPSIKVEGNGNFVFQSHSGSGDNIAGNKIQITNNHMTPQQTIQNFIANNQPSEAIALLYQISRQNQDGKENEIIQVESRLNALERQERLGMISFSDAGVERAKITSAILNLAGIENSGSQTQQRPTTQVNMAHSSNWESALLQIIKDNDRKNTDNVKRATTLLESFRAYYDLKRTRAFFDRSGEKLQEIEQSFEDFKKSLSKSGNESVEKFIDKVAGLIDAAIPDWPSIADAYALCVGRGMNDVYIERNLRATPNDDDAKLSAVQRIETFLGQL